VRQDKLEHGFETDETSYGWLFTNTFPFASIEML